ncbi:MAG: TolC family protein, partial [Bryobacteraceae bacterium]
MKKKLAILFLLAVCAFAQTEVFPSRVGVGPIRRELTLQEAVATALKNNLEIEIERTNRNQAAQAVAGAEGYLDPRFRWAPALDRRNQPTENALFGQNGKVGNNQLLQNFFLRQRLPWYGADFHIDFTNRRTSTNNPFASLNPFITSELSIGVTQPLFRNRLIDRERAQLTIRRKGVDLSQIDFEVRVIDIALRVEQAYWDLVAAREAVVVRADAVKVAREQLDRNRRQIDAGVLPPVELAASEAELQRRLDTWYASVNLVTETENGLKSLLAADRQSPAWGEEILPIEHKTVSGPPDIFDLRESADLAVKQRPEVRAVAVRQQINQVEKDQNANLVKPQVNLIASYISTGLAGTLQAGENPFAASSRLSAERLNELSARAGLPPIPTVTFGQTPGSLVGGYGQTLSNLFGGNYQSVQFGLEFEMPFRNREARSNLVQSNIVERRLKLQQAQIEQV